MDGVDSVRPAERPTAKSLYRQIVAAHDQWQTLGEDLRKEYRGDFHEYLAPWLAAVVAAERPPEPEPMLREVLSLGPLQLPHPDAPLNLSLTQWLKKTSEELYPWVATEPDGQVKPEVRRALDAYVKARIAEALRGVAPHQERASDG